MTIFAAAIAALSISAALLSLLATRLFIMRAHQAGMVDMPNARSSHTRPTPRGGGLAFVVTTVAALCLAYVAGLISIAVLIAFCGGGAIVAAIGFLDDRGHVAARYRLASHFAAAGLAMWSLGGLPALMIFGQELDLGWTGDVLAAIFIVWSINLTNFMDGIDGIAAVEAISVAAAAAIAVGLSGGTGGDILVPLVFAGAVAGFLVLNFPPARIFMGDVGSGFLGVALGTLAIWTASFGSAAFWSIIIAFGVFMVDATLTLMRRLIRGQKLYEAHRSHAYQYAARRHGSHRTVTLAVAMINLFWLVPLASAAAWGLADGALLATIAYLPLAVLAWRYKAGAHELQTEPDPQENHTVTP